MRKFYFLFLLFVAILGKSQQVSLYSFAQSTGIYTPLTGGTTSTATGDDAEQNGLPIGFTFNFGGVNYNYFCITTNGFIKLTTSASVTLAGGNYTNGLSATSTFRPLIAPMWDDNNTTAGAINYLSSGSVPNRKLTVEWNNVHIGGFGSDANPTGNFQIVLNETTNSIQFFYGAITTFSSVSASIGINDSTSFLSVTPATVATASSTTANDNVSSNTDIPSGTIYTFTLPAACSGTPTAGTINPASATVCSSSSTVLGVTGSSVGTGLTYQWQRSLDNSTWADITGATGATYTATGITTTTYYRRTIICSNGQSSFSTVATISVTAAAYATLPFQEQFENPWQSVCATRDLPTNNWRNSPVTGNSSWRRDDDGTAAAWTNTTLGAYTPAGSNNTPHSARFHSYYAGTTTPGLFDLYINTNTSAATKRLVFDYINTSGTDSLDVLISTDGGINFTKYLTLKIAATWTNQTIDFTTSSATTVIRFKATGGGTTDIGVDEVNVFNLTNCTGTPIAGTITSTTTSVCAGNIVSFGVSGETYGQAGITYQWQSSTDNVTFNDISTQNGLTYNLTVPTAYVSTYYRLVVKCSFSNQSAFSNVIYITTPAATYAALPFTETFEAAWINKCDTRDVPNNSWRNTPFTGNTSWRRDDDGTAGAWSSTFGNYTPTGSNGSAHSARFHSYDILPAGLQGSMDLYLNCNTSSITKRLRFDFINTSGTDTLTILLSTDNGTTFVRLDSMRTSAAWRTKTILFNSNSATTILRFRGAGDYGVTDIGLDNITVVSFPNCAGTPVGGTASASQTTACIGSVITLNLTGQSADQGGLTYKWQSSTNSTTWADISTPSADPSFVYTVPSGFNNTYFRAVDSCSFSNATGTSTSVLITVSAATYLSFPINQSFDSLWVSSCATRDVPTITGWKNIPFTGNNSWRREDDTTGGGWSNMLGTPSGSGANNSTHYARFHSYSATAGTPGNLDLYINCNTGPADKELSFYYLNPGGTDSLRVMLSTDGGTTFQPIGFRYVTSSTWSQKIIAFTSASATTVIRFAGYGTGDFSTDLGIDQIVVKTVECAQPPMVTSTVTSPSLTQSIALLKWRPVYNALAYEIVVSTSPDEPNAGDITGDTTYTVNTLLPVTTYYAFVRTLCFNGLFSSWYTYSFTTPCPSQTLPYSEGFESITVANQLPDCMAATGLSSNVLTYTAAQTTYNRTPHSGSKFASVRYGTPTGGAWIWTQPFTLNGGTRYDASFWYRTDGLAGWQILGLYYGTSQNAGSMVKIDSLTNVTTTEYLQMMRTFTAPSSGIYYLGIKVVATSAPWYLSIDDIGMRVNPTVPVTLLKFSGESYANYNQLTWITASETNNQGYSVERSKDGVNFAPLDFVKSKALNGNSTTQLTYTYQDAKPLTGINYYRLKQVDKDGKYHYSEIVTLKGNRAYNLELISVYPNPAAQVLHAVVASPKRDEVQLIITDMIGKQVYQSTQELQQGETNVSLNIANLANGSYILKLICKDGCNAGIVKFIKE